MINVLDDINLPRDKFVHVKNESDKPLDFIFNSKHFRFEPGSTELVNQFLYQHFAKSFENQDFKPLKVLEENEGNVEYARSRARHLESIAAGKIDDAKKAAAEAEEAKKKLLEARVAAKSFEKESKDEKK